MVGCLPKYNVIIPYGMIKERQTDQSILQHINISVYRKGRRSDRVGRHISTENPTKTAKHQTGNAKMLDDMYDDVVDKRQNRESTDGCLK